MGLLHCLQTLGDASYLDTAVSDIALEREMRLSLTFSYPKRPASLFEMVTVSRMLQVLHHPGSLHRHGASPAVAGNRHHDGKEAEDQPPVRRERRLIRCRQDVEVEVDRHGVTSLQSRAELARPSSAVISSHSSSRDLIQFLRAAQSLVKMSMTTSWE